MAKQSGQSRAFMPIRRAVEAMFAAHGVTVRVIYRTCQADFGRESPANLLSGPRSARDVTVYLDFKDERLAPGNLRRVVAFPRRAEPDLPLLERPRLHHTKVDLDRLPARYLFAEIVDLRDRCVSVLP